MADQKVHPFALTILHAIAVHPKDGARSAIPPAELKSFKERLLAFRDDRVLFEHLVVLYARLDRQHLSIAAAQLLTLAKVGLQSGELEKTIARVDAIERSLGMIDTAPTRAGSEKAFGAADERAAKAARERMKAAGWDPSTMVASLLALKQDSERRAALEAMRKVSFVDLVAATTDAAAREQLVVDCAPLVRGLDKRALIAALGAGASKHDALAALFLLQFGAGKELDALVQATAAAFPRDALLAIADGVRLANGKQLAQMI